MNALKVGDSVVVVDNTELEGYIPKVGELLTVSKIVDSVSNFIEFENGLYAFYGHRVIKIVSHEVK
jgi:hypothetical protein